MADGTTSSTSNTTLPAYIQPYVSDLFARSQALTGSQPYQPYTGQRVAPLNPMQTGAAQSVSGLDAGHLFTQGTNLTAQGANYTPGTQAYGLEAAQQYMNPFTSQVTDIAKREAVRNAQMLQTQNAAKLAQSGAFGGTRQAVMDAEIQRNLGQNLSDLDYRGLAEAYDKGAAQFNADQNRFQQDRQFGSQAAIKGGADMVDAGGKAFGLQSVAGLQQQQQDQKLADVGYQDFLGAQQHPYDQLTFMRNMISGFPGSTTTKTESQSSDDGGNWLSDAAGLVSTIGQAGNIFGWFAEGGAVDSAGRAGPQGGAADNIGIMRAKLKQDVPTLQLMASRGSIPAALALKQIVDNHAYARGLLSASAMQQPDVASVVSQLGEKAESFQQGAMFPGAPRYADGGVVEDPRFRLDNGQNNGGVSGIPFYFERRQPDPNSRDVLTGLWEALKRRGSAFTREGGLAALAGDDDTAYPEPTRVRESAVSPGARVDDRQARPSVKAGAAKAAPVAAPEPGLVAAGAATGMRPRGSAGDTSTPPAPAADAESGPDAELTKFLAAREALRTKGNALTEKQRALLEQTHNDTLKRLSRGSEGTMNKLVAWADGILAAQRANPKAKGLTLAGLGAMEANKTGRARDDAIAAEKTDYQRRQTLLDQAQLSAEAGDLESAYKLRKEAEDRGLKKQLTAAQIKQFESVAAENAADEALKRKKADAPGGAPGGKPMTEAQRAAWVRQTAMALQKQNPDMSAADAVAQARTLLDSAVLNSKSPTRTAAPAATGQVKFLGFE